MNFSRNIVGILTILSLYLLLIGGEGSSQEEPELSYLSLTDIGNIDPALDHYELSMSGQELAVINKESLCIYDIDTLVHQCEDVPWGVAYARGANGMQGLVFLEWSPDEQYIAFSREHFAGGEAWDTDIWLYDIASREIKNLTDDGIPDTYKSFEESDIEPEILDIPIDTLPIWDTSSQKIYFFRAYPEETGFWFDRFGLFEVSLDNFSVTQVYDFTEDFLPPVYAASLSPDNTKIVMAVGGSNINEGKTGIWILDMSQNQLDYTFPINNFVDALSEIVEVVGVTSFSDIAWRSNSQLYAVLQSLEDLDNFGLADNAKQQFFTLELEPVNILARQFPFTSTFGTSQFVSNRTDGEFIVMLEPNSQLQVIYYGNRTDGFQFVTELPYVGGHLNDRIMEIAENNMIISGGLLIELPPIP